MSILLAIIIFSITLGVRLYPIWNQPHRGTDAYVFLMYREAIREQKRIPVKFPPLFILEQREMWYPPGFPLILALLPNRVIEKYYWIISPFFDSLVNIVIYLVATLALDNSFFAFPACMIYAFSPTSIPETKAMNSRQLGSFLLNVTVFTCLAFATLFTNWICLSLGLIAIFILLMTHKLSTQAFALGIPTTALVMLDLNLMKLFALGISVAFIASFGFYWKILVSHWSFISFHSKNWQYLSAHMINDSPIYGKKTGLNNPFGKGFEKGALFTNSFMANNFYALFCVYVIFLSITNHHISDFILYCAIWCISVLLWALAIYWIPILRGIGFADQYSKLAAPAGLVCTAAALSHTYGWIALLLCMGGLTHHLIWYRRHIVQSNAFVAYNEWNFEEMETLISYLKQLDQPTVLTVPLSYSDMIAYKARVPVVWGAHNYPTDTITPIFPFFRIPLKEACEKFGVTHILVDTRFTDPKRIDIQSKPVFRAKNVELHPAP